MTVTHDGYHIIDDATAFRRGDTLLFGPVIDTARDLARRLGRSPRILDCGCGGGQLRAMLAARGVDCVYTGADIGLDNLAAGNRHYAGAGFVAADIHHLPFRDAAFDMAVAVGVLFLLPDAGVAIAEMRRVAGTVLADVLTAKQGSNSLKMRSSYGGWMTIPNGERNHDILADAGLPEPHQTLHCEVSTEDSNGHYAYQGITSRFQTFHIWHKEAETAP